MSNLYYISYYFILSDAKGEGNQQIADDDDESETASDNSQIEDALLKSSQSGSGVKRKLVDVEDQHLITKLAHLVSQNLVSQKLIPEFPKPRPVISNWSNYDLSPPSTSVLGTVNTTPALNFNQPLKKYDYNDVFGIETNNRNFLSN